MVAAFVPNTSFVLLLISLNVIMVHVMLSRSEPAKCPLAEMYFRALYLLDASPRRVFPRVPFASIERSAISILTDHFPQHATIGAAMAPAFRIHRSLASHFLDSDSEGEN